jgi:hypothetical protein
VGLFSRVTVGGDLVRQDDLLAMPPGDVPFEGVPEHLEDALRLWVRDALAHVGPGGAEAFAQAVVLRLRMVPMRYRNSGVSYADALLNVPA